MRHLTKGIIAGGLSVLMSLTTLAQANAMTMPDLPLPQTTQQQPGVQPVDWHGHHGHVWRGHGHYHGGGWHDHGGWHRHGYHDHGWHHGGYYHDNAWVPLAAFAAGAVIAGAASHPAYRSHAAWCASRYRTYRASDNTYQPLSGPRAQCR